MSPGLFDGTPLERPVTCEACGKGLWECTCPRDAASGKVLAPKDQAVRVRREQRRGKWVTVVTGLAARSAKSDELPKMLKELKAKLATGGTVVESDAKTGPQLELQGDHRDRVLEHFKKLGYAAKQSGG